MNKPLIVEPEDNNDPARYHPPGGTQSSELLWKATDSAWTAYKAALKHYNDLCKMAKDAEAVERRLSGDGK